MITQEQAAQVKQVVIDYTKRFVTGPQLEEMYKLDYAQYVETVEKGWMPSNTTYEEYFGDTLFDPASFLDLVAIPVLEGTAPSAPTPAAPAAHEGQRYKITDPGLTCFAQGEIISDLTIRNNAATYNMTVAEFREEFEAEAVS